MLDAAVLSAEQQTFVSEAQTRCSAHLGTLTPSERAIFTAIWTLMARTAAPVVVRSLHTSAAITQAALAKLVNCGLLWFDPDLRAVLQCPPFSALHTPHRVKVFGWDAAYTCSLIDVPLALLLYGPNTWLSAQSVCPRSGEKLAFRVLMADTGALKLDAPINSARWRVWLPELPPNGLTVGSGGTRSHINAFHSEADLHTYLHYRPDERGDSYTLEQALYLSQTLAQTYRGLLFHPH